MDRPEEHASVVAWGEGGLEDRAEIWGAEVYHGLKSCRSMGDVMYAIQACLIAIAVNVKRMVRLPNGMGFKGRARAMAPGHQAAGGRSKEARGSGSVGVIRTTVTLEKASSSRCPLSSPPYFALSLTFFLT